MVFVTKAAGVWGVGGGLTHRQHNGQRGKRGVWRRYVCFRTRLFGSFLASCLQEGIFIDMIAIYRVDTTRGLIPSNTSKNGYKLEGEATHTHQMTIQIPGMLQTSPSHQFTTYLWCLLSVGAGEEEGGQWSLCKYRRFLAAAGSGWASLQVPDSIVFNLKTVSSDRVSSYVQ